MLPRGHAVILGLLMPSPNSTLPHNTSSHGVSVYGVRFVSKTKRYTVKVVVSFLGTMVKSVYLPAKEIYVCLKIVLHPFLDA